MKNVDPHAEYKDSEDEAQELLNSMKNCMEQNGGVGDYVFRKNIINMGMFSQNHMTHNYVLLA